MITSMANTSCHYFLMIRMNVHKKIKSPLFVLRELDWKMSKKEFYKINTFHAVKNSF